jgi:hypothetical protein
MKEIVVPLVVRILRGLGYMSVLASWMWVLMFYIPYFTDTQVYRALVENNTQTAPVQPSTLITVPPSPFVTVLVLAIVVIIIFFALKELMKAPKAIERKGNDITRASTEAVVSVIVKKRDKTVKQRTKITAKVLYSIKCLSLVVPVMSMIPLKFMYATRSQIYGDNVPFVLFVGLVATPAVFGLVFFTIEHVYMSHVKLSKTTRD